MADVVKWHSRPPNAAVPLHGCSGGPSAGAQSRGGTGVAQMSCLHRKLVSSTTLRVASGTGPFRLTPTAPQSEFVAKLPVLDPSLHCASSCGIRSLERTRVSRGGLRWLEKSSGVDDGSHPVNAEKRNSPSNISSHCVQQWWDELTEENRAADVLKWALIASVVGLQACSEAWAGPEVAQAAIDSSFLGDLSDIQSGFASAFLLIFFSEIGDKTFFIAALLATRKSGAAVFSGTFGALTVMTIISVVLGRAFHYLDGFLPSFGVTKIPFDDLGAVVLLVYFGVTNIVEAASMEESKAEGEQQEAELAIAGVGANGAMFSTVAATFALVFVAEWGDKSFFSTIALAAASSPLGVVTGAIAGHGAATMLAVLGGSFLGNYVSEKTIAYVGGILFLVFAGVTLTEVINK